MAYPHAKEQEYTKWLSAAIGKQLSDDIIRAGLKRMHVTRKHIQKIAAEQDPVRFDCVLFVVICVVVRSMFMNFAPSLCRNTLWLSSGPPLGCAGVSADQLVDLDESFVFLSDSDRQYGFALTGKKAQITSKYIKGVKWTIMLAVSTKGVVFFWVHKESTTIELRLCCCFRLVCRAYLIRLFLQIYREFLEFYVLPKLERPCFIMNDNLSSHFGDVSF